ncbi:MAG: choice-of-anchor D domain-containing protein, partial [Bacteroidota bacterium]
TPEFEEGDPGPAWDGNIGRLTGDNLENLEIVISDLPRSVRDHLVNCLEFGPDGALYFPVAGNSAMGLADANWGDREERLLSAAVLRLDISKLPGTLPLNARTPEGGGTYNPFVVDAPLTLYATGVRNAYDLIWHSNGKLYAPANGSAAGGNAPTSDPTSPFYVAPDANITYTGPDTIPAAFNIEPTQPDWLYRIDPGGYYGHPNPIRAEYIVGRGDFEIDNPIYDGIRPDPNFREASFSFGPNKSPNGIIEFQSNAFGGLLQGKMMVVRYSQNDDIVILEPGGANQDIIASYVDPSGDQGLRGFADPLDLVEDVNTGNIYVSELAAGGKITLLQADVPATAVGVLSIDQTQLIDNGVIGNTEAAQAITFQNTGSSDLIINTIQVVGANAGEFQLSNLPTLPFTLAPGATGSIDVAFAPTLVGVSVAQVEFATNNPTTPTSQVELRALGTTGLGEDNEPSLQIIMDAFNINVTVGDEDVSNPNFQITPPLELTSRLGDEVFVSQFQKASSEPVTIEVLASFANTSADPICTAGFYDVDNPTDKTDLFSIPRLPLKNGQSLTPPVTGTTSFNPDFNEPFGFFSRWTAFSNREVFSEDY